MQVEVRNDASRRYCTNALLGWGVMRLSRQGTLASLRFYDEARTERIAVGPWENGVRAIALRWPLGFRDKILDLPASMPRHPDGATKPNCRQFVQVEGLSERIRVLPNFCWRSLLVRRYRANTARAPPTTKLEARVASGQIRVIQRRHHKFVYARESTNLLILCPQRRICDIEHVE
jgi:hypothetical protein